MTPRQRTALFSIFLFAVIVQYCYKLDGMGVFGPDEPRYVAIGREMALHGNWITPHLWGAPWFEKPPLIYWMTAIGTGLHLNIDLAGRLPVALLSLGFLITWFLFLKAEFDELTAAISTVLLATSSWWFAYSSICVTDVPMAVFFSLAIACSLRIMSGGRGNLPWLALGASMGMAMLSKGLVPIVLATPMLWFLREQWRRWWMAVIASGVVAGPWYVLVYLENGAAFINVFFFQQQFSRMYSGALQHVQPVYFYVPILLGAIFPWTPFLLAIRPSIVRQDRRLIYLAVVVLFGFVFFSLSLNKLPGYLIPLLPALFVLVGSSIKQTEAYQRRGLLIACAIMTALIPFVGQLIPILLTSKVRLSPELLLAFLPITTSTLILFVTPLLISMLPNKGVAMTLLVLCSVVATTQLKSTVYPILDKEASPRGLWRELGPRVNEACDGGLHRAWQYGMALYTGKPLPLCDVAHAPVQLVQRGSQPARIVVSGSK